MGSGSRAAGGDLGPECSPMAQLSVRSDAPVMTSPVSAVSAWHAQLQLCDQQADGPCVQLARGRRVPSRIRE